MVQPGVYVPRWHTESVAWRAVARMPRGGTGIDLCTGSGAIAAVLIAEREARMVATDLDPLCVACARANGVDARVGDLFDGETGPFDVVTAVVPYVPTSDLPLLQRDTFAFETTLAYDGGEDGLDLARRVVDGARARAQARRRAPARARRPPARDARARRLRGRHDHSGRGGGSEGARGDSCTRMKSATAVRPAACASSSAAIEQRAGAGGLVAGEQQLRVLHPGEPERLARCRALRSSAASKCSSARVYSPRTIASEPR